MPLVSVVVPTFNGVRFVGDTLRCVLSQTHADLELIVIDDGSTDGTQDLVRMVAPQARLIQQKNAGVSSARNRGLAEAGGDFVIFLDQDDIWHPLQLERQVACLQRDPACGAVVCHYRHWPANAGVYPSPESLWGADPGLLLDPDFTGWVYHQFLWDCWAQTSGTLLRRTALQACGGYNTTLAYSEDWDLWLRLSLQVPFATLRWPCVLYRHHDVQGSRTVRVRDYRTELLESYAAQHGLASRDGRRMDAQRFRKILSGYHYSHGMLHLVHGQRPVSLRSFWKAWKYQPARLKLLLLAAAAACGWKPARG